MPAPRDDRLDDRRGHARVSRAGHPGLTLGPLTRTLPEGSFLYPNDILTFAVVQQNLGRRPIVWASTAGRSFAGLGDYVVQRGLGFELLPALPDTTIARPRPAPLRRRAARRPHHRAAGVRHLSLRRAGERGAPRSLESTSASVAATLGLPPALLVYAYAGRRDRSRLREAAELSSNLSGSRDLRTALQAVVDSVTLDTGGPSESAAPSPAITAQPQVNSEAMDFPALPGSLARVRDTVARHQAIGGWTHPVRIVAVTKTHGPRRSGRRWPPGSRTSERIGSRRPRRSRTHSADVPVAWHLIGTLQRNKARHAAGRFALIHSLDRADLAVELDRRVAPGAAPGDPRPSQLQRRAAEGRGRARWTARAPRHDRRPRPAARCGAS